MFKKTVSVNGKYKALMVSDGNIIDVETGEEVDLVGTLSSIYGEDSFSLSTSSKADQEIEA